MSIAETGIGGLLVVRSEMHHDRRGFFRQAFQVSEIAAALGRDVVLSQGNHSRSGPGVIRGFHAEPWDKLVQVIRGRAMCVVADLRIDSPTFGRTRGFTLGDPPGELAAIFVSKGLANAFYTLEETDYVNDVSADFAPTGRVGIRWNDPDLGVCWPLIDGRPPILSDADAAQPYLREAYPDRFGP